MTATKRLLGGVGGRARGATVPLSDQDARRPHRPAGGALALEAAVVVLAGTGAELLDAGRVGKAYRAP